MKLNYPAIVVAAVVHWLFAAVWFTAFKAPYLAGLRMTPQEIEYAQTHMTPWPYVIAFICALVLAYGLACIVTRTGDPREHTVGRGLRYGFGFGLAIAAAIVAGLVFEQRPTSFIAVAAGYPFVGMIIMGAILGAWRRKQAVEMPRAARA